MKKVGYLLLSSIILSLSFSVCAFAESQDTHTDPENSLQDEQTTLMKDITPIFTIPNMENILVNTEGDITVELFDNIKDPEGRIKAYVSNNDIIKIDEKGHWKALKAGETTFTLFYEYSEKAINELKNKYPGFEFAQQEIAVLGEVSVIEADKKELDITPNFIFDDLTNLTVKDTGSIKVAPIEGVEVTGSFSVVSDEHSIITLDKDGNWAALKAGNASLPLNFEYSQDTMDRLAEKFPNTSFLTRVIPQAAIVTVFDGTFSLKPVVTNLDISAKVGDTGKLELAPISGVDDLQGIFEMIDPKGIIEIDENGNWKALKAGTTQVSLNVRLTDESISKIKNNNPFKREAPSSMELQTINVTIAEKDVPADLNKPNDNSKKALPQTSNRLETSYTLIGTIILGFLWLQFTYHVHVKKMSDL